MISYKLKSFVCKEKKPKEIPRFCGMTFRKFVTPSLTKLEMRRKICLGIAAVMLLFAAGAANVFAGTNGTVADSAQVASKSVSATDTNGMPEGYSDIVDSLPDDVKDSLPDGIYSNDIGAAGEAVTEMTTGRFLLNLLGDITGARLGQALSLLAKLVGLIVIASVFSTVRSSLGSETLGAAVSFCTSCIIFAAILQVQYRQLMDITHYFERLGVLMYGYIPVTSAVYAMGGNLSTAAVNSSALYLLVAVLQSFCAGSIIPVGSICSALALCGAVSPKTNLKGVAATVKKSYTFILGLIMTILITSLAGQTTIAAASDGIAAKAAKAVSSNVIPVVGGSVGDTLRTVASGVSYMKSIIGIGGIIFIAVLLLPTLITLLLTRLAFMLSGGIADILGCDSESRLLGEISNVYGMLIAVVAMSSVMFILAMYIFVKCSVAIS